MSARSTTEVLFIVAWLFEVKPEHRSAFERAYGRNGEWVHLFRTGDGYLRTELHRDPNNPGHYITLDFWQTREQYDAFREQSKSAYEGIDARCERLTARERLLGDFADVASVRAAFPSLGPQTEISPHFTIRSVNAGDISEIMRLERSAASAAHWTQESYDAVSGDDAPPRIAFVAENANRKLCGFVVARLAADECELENIVVGDRETRHGIGSALLEELSQAARSHGAKRIFLEVRESNLPARSLYEKLGFTRDAERVAYYSDPTENAILYSLKL